MRNDFFRIRDQLRIINTEYKSIKFKTANDYWKFCFGDNIPYHQTSLLSFETNNQGQINLKMIKLSVISTKFCID